MKETVKGDGPYTHGQSGGNGPAVPPHLRRDWQLAPAKAAGTTIYDMP